MMRAVRLCGAMLLVLGAILLLERGEDLPSVGHAQSPVPTSTRPAPPPLPTPTPTPKPHPSKSKSSSPPPPTPEPTVAPVLPEAGAAGGGEIGQTVVLALGGAALAVGLALRRRRKNV